MKPTVEKVKAALEQSQGGCFTSDFASCFSDVPEFGGTRKFEWRQKEDCAFCAGA